MKSHIRLSLLVCTLPKRHELRTRLLNQLQPQCDGRPVEVRLGMNTEKTIGAVRNLLLKEARGDYVCFIDDDDEVSPGYVQGILDALASSPDCVAMPVTVRTGGLPGRFLLRSRDYPKFKTMILEPDPNPYLIQAVNHINPVHREIALSTGFSDIDAGEDFDYSRRLRRLLHREAVPGPGVQYFHNFDRSLSSIYSGSCLYRNRFGGVFSFMAVCTGAKKAHAVASINSHCLAGVITQRVNQGPQRWYRMYFNRMEARTCLSINGVETASVATPFDKPVTVEIAPSDPTVRLLRLEDAYSDGLKVHLTPGPFATALRPG